MEGSSSFFFFCRCCCPFALSTSPNPRRNENNTKCALCVCVSRPLEPLSCYVFLLCFVFFFSSLTSKATYYLAVRRTRKKKKKRAHTHTHTHTRTCSMYHERKKKITYAASGRRRTVRVSSPSALCTRSSSADTKRCRGGGFSSFNSCSDSRTDWGHLTKKPGIISFRS